MVQAEALAREWQLGVEELSRSGIHCSSAPWEAVIELGKLEGEPPAEPPAGERSPWGERNETVAQLPSGQHLRRLEAVIEAKRAAVGLKRMHRRETRVPGRGALVRCRHQHSSSCRG